MKIYDNQLITGLVPLDNLIKLVPIDDILFFDIETTGLSKINNHIYLIGCGYYTPEGLNIIQWFAENEQEEIDVLKAFIDFSSSFSCLVNYNGKSFDIPFTSARMEKYGLSMPNLESVDLYTIVKPLKRLLSLNDLTQKSIENFLGIKRNDKYNGGELIPVYKEYVKITEALSSQNAKFKNVVPDILINKSKDKLQLLLLHNYEDVLNMHEIVKIFDYGTILDEVLMFTDYEIKEFTSYNGMQCKELIIHGLHNSTSICKSFKSFKNTDTGSYIMNFSTDGTVKIRIPIIFQTLYYYLENYKDYYYLPNEDMCILKSMAGGVLKENRINATKDTCRIALTTSYIPVTNDNKLTSVDLRIFKESSKSKHCYINLEDFKNADSQVKTLYLKNIFNIFI